MSSAGKKQGDISTIQGILSSVHLLLNLPNNQRFKSTNKPFKNGSKKKRHRISTSPKNLFGLLGIDLAPPPRRSHRRLQASQAGLERGGVAADGLFFGADLDTWAAAASGRSLPRSPSRAASSSRPAPAAIADQQWGGRRWIRAMGRSKMGELDGKDGSFFGRRWCGECLQGCAGEGGIFPAALRWARERASVPTSTRAARNLFKFGLNNFKFVKFNLKSTQIFFILFKFKLSLNIFNLLNFKELKTNSSRRSKLARSRVQKPFIWEL